MTDELSFSDELETLDVNPAKLREETAKTSDAATPIDDDMSTIIEELRAIRINTEMPQQPR